jgi:hypothetical protein
MLGLCPFCSSAVLATLLQLRKRLEGHNKLPKIIDGVKFVDGIEFAAKIDGPRSLRSRLALATTEKQRAKDIA